MLEFNKYGNIKDKFIRRTDFNIDMAFLSYVSQSYDNTYFIRPQENENICYKIVNGKLSKFSKLFFGRYNIPSLYSFKDDKNPWENLEEVINSDYYKFPFHIQKTQKHLYFSAFGPNSIICNFLIDIDSGKGINWNSGTNITPLFILCSDKEYFYSLFDKYQFDIEDNLDEINPLLKYIIVEKKLKLKQDQNPVIVKFKFKNGLL